jgi:hypothetical protein
MLSLKRSRKPGNQEKICKAGRDEWGRPESRFRLLLTSHRLEIMTPMLAAGGGTLAVLAILAAIFSAIFWMVVGWRAMKAHERLADAAEYIVRKFRESDKP